MCKSRFFFKQYPTEYDMNDDYLYHEFRKCMFALQIRSGLYTFRNKKNGDYMNYRIVNKSYASSYGILNGSPVKIDISREQ